MSSILTVTAKGQVTLRKDVLDHLGVHPGDKITVNKLPDGRIEVKAATNRNIFGCFRFIKSQTQRQGAFHRGHERHHCPRPGRQAMKIAADTNVLVRALTEDHPEQSKAANRS